MHLRPGGLRLFRLFARRLEPDRSCVSPAGTNLRLMEEAELGAHCDDAELDLTKAKVAAAHARGDRCVGAVQDGRLVGYCWLAFSPLPHLDGVWAGFSPDAVWTYKSFVRPSHRGRGIAAALYRSADRLCGERGRSMSLLCVELRNQRSIRAARRAGYAPAGYAGYLHRGGMMAGAYSPAAKRTGVRFFLPAPRV